MRLFRKIRQLMISSNRFRNYTVYALGEIILISAGLLIALQLNNLNDQRKTRQYEIKMMNEVREALKDDLWYFKILTDRMQMLDTAATALLNLYGQSFEETDTIDRYLDHFRLDIQFYYNRGPYEAIKSSGLDRITDDAIRKSLVRHYDFWVPRTEALLKDMKADMDEESKVCFPQVFRFALKRSETGEILPSIPHLKHPGMNLNEQFYLRILLLKKGYAKGTIRRLEHPIESSERLLERLDAKLGPAEIKQEPE